MAVATEGLEKLEEMIVRQAGATGPARAGAKAATGSVIVGQEGGVEQALIPVLCGGHALLIGLPGLAKTKLVETRGIVLGLDARRIQFTPDLMPSDILGSEVLDEVAPPRAAIRQRDLPRSARRVSQPPTVRPQSAASGERRSASPRRSRGPRWRKPCTCNPRS